MRTLLIVLTVVEIVVFVGALATYLIVIARSLRRISQSLGKVTFGVRAIETQCASVGPSVTRVNEQLTVIAGALDGVAGKAERLGAGS
jgi:ABC-type branched-subunit amino acid transport system permease subunit